MLELTLNLWRIYENQWVSIPWYRPVNIMFFNAIFVGSFGLIMPNISSFTLPTFSGSMWWASISSRNPFKTIKQIFDKTCRSACDDNSSFWRNSLAWTRSSVEHWIKSRYRMKTHRFMSKSLACLVQARKDDSAKPHAYAHVTRESADRVLLQSMSCHVRCWVNYLIIILSDCCLLFVGRISLKVNL